MAVATKPTRFRMVMFRLGSTINGKAEHAAYADEQAGPEQGRMPHHAINARIGDHAIQHPGNRRARDEQQHDRGHVGVENGNVTRHVRLLWVRLPARVLARPSTVRAATADRAARYE